MMLLALVLACSGSGEKTDSSPTGGSGGLDTGSSSAPGPATVDISDWSGGSFEFQTVSAKDSCLGGAFEALFMPDGPSLPYDFDHEIYIPDFADLPETYTIDLRSPFVAMPVTVDSADDRSYQIRGSVMSAVELGRASYGDCVVNMTVDVDLTPTGADTATGNAVISISDPRGDDGLCPVFDVSPCDVELGLTARR